ncbi:PaaX family transcriptional regulator [Stackebrandtia nassauensis]|uniref:Transcriptional regulator, PaaX family n=1 Tax=Stackebrandtia nassauensis (strain DSM 44728 / CIP 108903 / NRRL B-16338 / NBRC 102104 / LLR-40K-21) TaxID=446470 RepID=D3Q717_STANL|nr:PaaX family transcriptional regulator C-terminal domain-containing protein [Stackebrandtia nassauensis]ADD40416.1 transcriptional regulator, PaaX family [Stackebrandtia nassauensis DSM 44728]
MHARSALFDVYGDHLRQWGHPVPVAALVALLEPLGVNAPAVRTAVSRMVRQGWLAPVDLGGQRGYAPTDRAKRRLDESATRIYRTETREWDGSLDLVVFTPPRPRPERARLVAALRFHGYGPLTSGTWVSPWCQPELPEVFTEADVEFERFRSVHNGDTVVLTRRAWNLDELADRYRAFTAELAPIVEAIDTSTPDSRAYAARMRLLHAFRVFLFSDPGLPAELCPPHWAGHTAAAFFDTHAARLRPAADRFVSSLLTT